MLTPFRLSASCSSLWRELNSPVANQEHVDILRRGIVEWNRWTRTEEYRTQKRYREQPDLSEADLRALNLGKISTDQAIRIGAKLEGDVFERDHIDGFNFDQVNFREANLSGVTFEGSDCNSADFSEAILYNAGFAGTDLYRAKFRGADLRNAEFPYARLERADFSYADLSDTRFEEINMREVTFRGANLSRAVLSGSDLMRANFWKANLSGTDLGHIDLFYVNMNGASFNRTFLESTLFRHTELSNADLSNAILWETIFSDVDLSQTQGLEAVEHRGPSTIGIDTIIRSKGNIPELFLRGAGVPDNVIEYARALVKNPIEYYTCFISYSNKDQEFAERLYADLQAKGVRCWFAPEDMKIGDKIRHRIDESIRVYDKLLLVLSEHSVKSEWVEYEVEAALDKEKPGKLPVLFPIRIDKAIMESTMAWATHIKRTRHIGDFECWENNREYKKAFDRLLRDLKAGE
jgi:uncharacterized protein YjbI with pentapeptide repeats